MSGFTAPHANDVLSLAVPTAFGFLDSDISPITFEGGEISDPDDEDHAVIRVSEGKTVSVIGGGIEMRGISYRRPATDDEGNPVYEQAADEQGDPVYEIETGEDGEPLHDDDGQPVYRTDENGENIPVYVTDENGDPVQAVETVNPPNIAAPAGQISMIAAGSESEVDIANPVSEIGSPKSDITLSDKAKTDVSGTGAGSVFIRSGRLFADDSTIQAKTLGDQDGGRVDIQADDMSFTRGANINCQVEGAGRGADVGIRASGPFLFAGESSDAEPSRIGVETGLESKDAGDGGTLLVEAEDISFADGARIESSTHGTGRGGEVTLKADSVSFDGEATDGLASSVRMVTWHEGEGAGDAGTLLIDAKDIAFTDGAYVYSTTWGKGRGGDVTLKADSVSFAGESSLEGYGGYDGYASDIYMRTEYEGEGAGDAGTLLIEAKDISFTDGAYIDSATYGRGGGGDVTIRAEEAVTVAGASTEGKPSRIYAGSESTAPDAGDGGSITVSARRIFLSDSGEISTSAAGSGNAGSVELSAAEIRLDSGAVNFHEFGNMAERDAEMLFPGDVVDVADTGEGTSDRYVSADTLTRFPDIYEVADLTERDRLGERHALSQGDIAEVRDAGNGASARYVYTYESQYETEAWVRFDSEHTDVTVADMTAIYGIDGEWLSSEEALPHKPGDVIRVVDTGDGRPGIYIYAPTFDYFYEDRQPWWYGQTVRLSRFDAADTAALNDLPNQLSVRDGDVARVADAGDRAAADFMFQNGEWIRFGTVHAVADQAAMNALTVPRTGHVAEVGDTGNGPESIFVFSGKEWVSLNKSHTVPDMAAMGNLAPETGDVVYVADTDNDENRQTPANFLYAEDGWTEFVKGDADRITITADTLTMTNSSSISTSTRGHGNAGDITLKVNRLDIGTGASVTSGSSSEIFGGSAGTITVEAGDSVRLGGEKALSTDAKGAGGGKIDVTAGNEIYLLNGGISSSVALGVGKGGDVTAESKFVIMNHGGITANADEGGGGAIFIRTENFLKSSDSSVTAASNRGNEGNVRIEAPDVDISGGLIILPGTVLDAARWIKKPCSERTAEDVSRFVIKGRDATPTPPDDLQASPPRPFGSSD